jgi:hypothetical protein
MFVILYSILVAHLQGVKVFFGFFPHAGSFPRFPAPQEGIFFHPGKLEKTLRINNISGSFSFHRGEHNFGPGIIQNTLRAMGKVFPPWKWGFLCSES